MPLGRSSDDRMRLHRVSEFVDGWGPGDHPASKRESREFCEPIQPRGAGLSWGIMLNSGIVGVNVNAPGYYPGNIRAEPHGA